MANGIQAKLNIGSTDANEPLSRGLPAICVGLTTGGRSHSIEEYIDTKPLALGLGMLGGPDPGDLSILIYKETLTYGSSKADTDIQRS